MSLKLKSRKLIKKVLLTAFLLSGLASLTVYLFDLSWNGLDYKYTDYLYKRILKENKGPKVSDKIIYLNITDKFYNTISSNYLNRKALANINHILNTLNTSAVFYDIIFPRSSSNEDDSLFAESIKELGNVYLPSGFKLSEKKIPFNWDNGFFFSKLKNKYLKKLDEKGEGSPYYADRVLPQMDIFSEAAFKSGHISIINDPDGILRHFPLLIKIDSLFFPGIALAMFLDYNKIPFEKIKVDWGNSITIPALKEGYLDNAVIIPIDDRGKVFIPYQGLWADGKTKSMDAQGLIDYSSNEEYTDELLDYFEGNFIFINDVSIGTSDLGQTTVEDDVPLITVHAALMNAFLTNTFYKKWDSLSAAFLIFPIGILLGFSAVTKSNITLYLCGILFITGLIYFSYIEITSFTLFPLVTITGSVFLIFLGLIIALYFFAAKDQAFIKNAFSKYVPAKIVDELLEKPELLKLGGEERVITILFSDIADFTTISESLKPTDLVSLLNNYLTEMTNIIHKNSGTVDKFLGDAILAEFGAPIQMENHAEFAVQTALMMQEKIRELGKDWNEKGLPQFRSRIGINTGSVIIGNMGSDEVFDYTAIGDAVNLAARLESANKKYGSEILISEFTFKNLPPDKFRTRLLDVIKVKGKTKAVKVYQLYGFTNDPIDECYDRYETGFNLYLNRDLNQAMQCFNEALIINQSDKASLEMIARIEMLKDKILEEDWDGSITLIEK